MSIDIRASGTGYSFDSGSATPPPLIISVTTPTLPDQLTLAAVADLEAAAGISVAGGTAPYTYQWSDASGGTFGDDEALDSSWTPTAGGVHTLVLTVEDADGATATAVVVVTVGVQDTESGGYWIEDWSSDDLTHDFLTAGATVTHDGVLITLAYTATAPTEAAFAAGALAIDTVNGFVHVYIPAAYDATKHVRWGMAIDAGLLTADNDSIEIVRALGGRYHFARAIRVGGWQNVSIIRDGTGDNKVTAGGGQARVLEMECIGYGMRTLYSESAFSTYVQPSALSKHNDVPSGWYVAADIAPSASADVYTSAGTIYFEVRGDNGRRYTFPRIYRLVKA